MTHEPNNKKDSSSRRDFLKIGAGVGAAAAGLAAGAIAPTAAVADDFSPFDIDPSVDPLLNARRRAVAAFNLKDFAARQHLGETFALGRQRDNNDEQRYAGERYYASFTKTLPCNRFGEVSPAAFEALQRAMSSGTKTDFDAIPLARIAARTLANPQGAFRYEVAGLDSHATRMPPSHRFRSARLAGEMGEVYWQALTRDVPFSQYDGDTDIAAAVSDLNHFSAPPGATVDGQVTTGTLFRGETPGDLVGPYISQFLWKPFNFGPVEITQRYKVPKFNNDYMVSVDDWLFVQRGGAPAPTDLDAENEPPYIYNNRSLAEYVHRDVLYQAYLHAALILLGFGGDVLDPGNPYRSEITNQGPFTSLGGPFIIDLVSRAGNLALSGAWFQKWRVHRLLRPEAYAGRVHFHLTEGRDYELHPDILRSAEDHFQNNGTYLLPQAYPEGSPTHPSYPAGHGAVAGACVTVLKACFDERFVIPDPVQANDDGTELLAYGDVLTVGGELNKLANNVAIGRDAAGVHYRQDGVEGLVIGEQQAIALLQDVSRTVNESDFDGFTLTKFDGSRINIKEGQVSLAYRVG